MPALRALEATVTRAGAGAGVHVEQLKYRAVNGSPSMIRLATLAIDATLVVLLSLQRWLKCLVDQ
jgi:hypothetical protein